MFEGSLSAKILFVSDFLRSDEDAFQTVLSDQRKQIIVGALNRAGVPESDYAFTVIYPFMPPGLDTSKVPADKRTMAAMACRKLIQESSANVIVPLGENALNFITGLSGIQKQKCSILKVKAEFGDKKAIPLPHPEYVQKVWEEQAYVSFGCSRIKTECQTRKLDQIDRRFRLSLDCSFEEIISYLEDKVLKAPELAIDVETGRGIVNTHGFAISPSEAIAINVLPSAYSPAQFHKLWSLVRDILESDIPKIAQNAVYESQWASLYGINLRNISFDTMWAMKLLCPTLEKGLDNIGRLYTRQPYWKDDGKDWNDIRNWRDHLNYNCKDTVGTFEAKENMQVELNQRGLAPLFESYMESLMPQCQRMTNAGLLVSAERLETIREDFQRDLHSAEESLDRLTESKLGRKINPASPKQVKAALKELGIKVPTKAGSETVSKDSLAKLRKTYPDEMIIKDLINISKLSSQLETYFNFNYDQDCRLRFSIDALHNEYGEWSSSKNPFDKGFSLEGVPKKTREFLMVDEGYEFLEVKFYKPELTYLAYDSGDPKMIRMVQQHENIPVILASQMFSKQKDIINPMSIEARIAEQAVYDAAYGMSSRAFAIKTVGEFGKAISEGESRRILSIVFESFPGLRRRQERIQSELKRTRTLTSLLGRQITYYERLNDDCLRKAYQWGFRSLHADMLNRLSSIIDDNGSRVVVRNNKGFLISCTDAAVNLVIEIGDTPEHWHPSIKTNYGMLQFFPIFKRGLSWGGLK